MELSEFIKNTMIDVYKGVENAQNEAKKEDTEMADSFSIGAIAEEARIKDIEFDLQVSITKKGKVEGKAGIEILGMPIRAGIFGARSTQDLNSSRIRFKIPIKYPSIDRFKKE